MQDQHIEFLNIRPTYTLDESIPVYFRPLLLTKSKPIWGLNIGDCIAICKLNSGSLSSCLSHKVITRQLLEEFAERSEFYVVFDKSELPTDMTSEYQFVYFSKYGSIKGTSIPIRFVLLRKTLEEPLQQRVIRSLPLSKEYFFDAIEKGLLKQNERLTSNLRLTEDKTENELIPRIIIDSNVGIEKFLTEFKSNPLQYVKTIEEILNENVRLTNVLECKNKELVELRDEVKDIKSLIGDLIKRLSISERKVYTYEREKRTIEPVSTQASTTVRSGLENGLKSSPVSLSSEFDSKLKCMFPILDEIRMDGKLPLNFDLLGFLENEFKQICDKPGVQKEKLLNLIESMHEKHGETKPIVPPTLYRTEVKHSLPLTKTKINLIENDLIPSDLPSIINYLPGILPCLPPNLSKTEHKKILEEIVSRILKGETSIPTSKSEVRSKIVEDSIVNNTITKPIDSDYSLPLYRTTVREEDVTSCPPCPVCGIKKPKQTELGHFINHVNSHY